MNSYFCKYCGGTKPEDAFTSSELENKSPKCKECRREYSRQYRLEHKEQIKQYRAEHKQEILEYNIQYRIENSDKIKESGREYYQDNKEIIQEKRQTPENKDKKKEWDKKSWNKNRVARLKQKKQYNDEHKMERNARERNKRKENPALKLRQNVSSMIGQALKKNGGSKRGMSIFDYLSYTQEELWNYIEKQFEPWMNKDNQGIYDPKTWDDNDPSTWKWQLDHIIPHSTFHYETMDCDEFLACWALSNLRPLSAKQNFLDGINRVRHTNQ